MKKYVLIAVPLLVFAGCGQRRTGTAPVPPRAFPQVEIPAMITEPGERLKYLSLHFWDKLPDEGRVTDSLTTAGVPVSEVEAAMATFATIVREIPPREGEKAMAAFFDVLEASPDIFQPMVSLTERYFYDPNSPLRSEDLYLPFVTRLSESGLTDPVMKGKYAWDAKMCALNRPGTTAADFRFTDTAGRSRTLHGVKAEYLILIFGNPDCTACRELQETMESSLEIGSLLSSGRLKVVDIFIDRDVDAWKSKASSYPRQWINGYDPEFKIREDLIYDVRAIPSIYLLDSGKTVILKDATPESLMAVLSSL